MIFSSIGGGINTRWTVPEAAEFVQKHFKQHYKS